MLNKTIMSIHLVYKTIGYTCFSLFLPKHPLTTLFIGRKMSFIVPIRKHPKTPSV